MASFFEYEQSGDEEIKAAAAVSSSLPCSNLCYASSKAHQPNDANLLKKTEKIYGSGKHARRRHFVASWYKSYPWLHFCSTTL